MHKHFGIQNYCIYMKLHAKWEGRTDCSSSGDGDVTVVSNGEEGMTTITEQELKNENKIICIHINHLKKTITQNC